MKATQLLILVTLNLYMNTAYSQEAIKPAVDQIICEGQISRSGEKWGSTDMVANLKIDLLDKTLDFVETQTTLKAGATTPIDEITTYKGVLNDNCTAKNLDMSEFANLPFLFCDGVVSFLMQSPDEDLMAAPHYAPISDMPAEIRINPILALGRDGNFSLNFVVEIKATKTAPEPKRDFYSWGNYLCKHVTE